MKQIRGLYLILDQQHAKRDIVSIAEEAVEAGIDVIQYRGKSLSKKDTLKIAEKLRNLTAGTEIPFIINDDPALALASDADGVHLGQEDIPVHIARRILGKDKI
ncbi:MAG: thiamine phosphate synthase, partial [Nitrospirota bacterium]